VVTVAILGRKEEAAAVLDDAADFERDIEAKIRDFSQPKRELLMLAWRRLISAVAPTIGDREASFFATRQFKRACAEAAFLGCH
jgi:hypothetical protein